MTTVPVEAKAAATIRRFSIISPAVDLLCVGGLSILVLVPLLLSGRADLGFVTLGALAWIQILVNMSHFMASYRILYRSRDMIVRHRWAALGVPAILVLFIKAALAQTQAGGAPLLLGVLVAVSSGYLAWHYTGQTWGMMASHAHLAGNRFDETERILIRTSLRILLAWHLIWFVRIWFQHTSLAMPAWVGPAYNLISAAALLALALGGYGLLKMRARTGRFPPAPAVVAWLAIFVWYAAMARWGLLGLFLVQLAHALQYLEFPARVELNRATRTAAGRAARHMALYVGALVAVSFLVTLVVPGPAMGGVAEFFEVAPQRAAPILILMFINIHHYFTDGVIWKLSNPEVRRELFAHMAPAETPAPAAASVKRESRKRRKQRR